MKVYIYINFQAATAGRIQSLAFWGWLVNRILLYQYKKTNTTLIILWQYWLDAETGPLCKTNITNFKKNGNIEDWRCISNLFTKKWWFSIAIAIAMPCECCGGEKSRSISDAKVLRDALITSLGDDGMRNSGFPWILSIESSWLFYSLGLFITRVLSKIIKYLYYGLLWFIVMVYYSFICIYLNRCNGSL